MDELIREEKKLLRQRLFPVRDRLADKHQKSLYVADVLKKLRMEKNSQTVLSYVPIGSEVDVTPFLQDCLVHGVQVFAPFCPKDGGPMALYRFLSFSELRKGHFQVPEPLPLEENRFHPGEETKAILCLVPGIAFDAKGNRLGYGKGYYDRFLADIYKVNGVNIDTLGITYEALVISEIPVQQHDERVRALVTERGVISCFSPRTAGKDEEYGRA